jgi:hypothetical protein
MKKIAVASALMILLSPINANAEGCHSSHVSALCAVAHHPAKHANKKRSSMGGARSRPAVQSALDRAALVGHSYACSSGSPLESEASKPQLPRSEPHDQPNESSQLAKQEPKHGTKTRVGPKSLIACAELILLAFSRQVYC